MDKKSIYLDFPSNWFVWLWTILESKISTKILYEIKESVLCLINQVKYESENEKDDESYSKIQIITRYKTNNQKLFTAADADDKPDSS